MVEVSERTETILTGIVDRDSLTHSPLVRDVPSVQLEVKLEFFIEPLTLHIAHVTSIFECPKLRTDVLGLSSPYKYSHTSLTFRCRYYCFYLNKKQWYKIEYTTGLSYKVVYRTPVSDS